MVDFNVKSTFSAEKFLKLAQDDEILIGIVEGQTHATSGEDVSDIARDLSFGTAEIPARPFLEEGILSVQQELTAAIEQRYRNIVEAKDWETQSQRDPKGLKKIAVIAVGGVKNLVYSEHYKNEVPNAWSTIYRKSKKNKKGEITGLSDKPLIDTGQMINSVTYVINGNVTSSSHENMVERKEKREQERITRINKEIRKNKIKPLKGI